MQQSAETKDIKIIAFGIIAEKIGGRELVCNGISDTGALRQWLANKYPGLNGLKFSIAVNRKLVHENCTFDNESEIALLPPFSGG
ncbi:MAG: MoaD/ThiS family protein [Bacteroidetes bacterium]|nr:MoaD/ThiS family protein [Bacteroidota bacterium]MBS1973205.1 MoaD/ThiS family protein [Bacteroidota bacterium]